MCTKRCVVTRLTTSLAMGAGLIIGAALAITSPVGADVVNIGVGNTYYNPPYPVVQPGDTIHWFRVAGNHDVTSGRPCDEEDGLFYAPITSSNPTFDWTVPADASGAIVYYCGVGGHCVSGDQYGALLVGTGPAHVIETNGMNFDPADITVEAGDVVVWHNTGGFHDVTFGTNCTDEGVFSEPLTAELPHVVYVVPADHPGGVIDYFCTPHCGAGMVGTITVEGSGTDCPGDADESGDVNVDDVLAVITVWGQSCDCSEDVTDDGQVNIDDLLLVLSAYGQSC
ncbi:MAG: plastocyanin/azurin family copper-binding protein [Phycisphaerales bacterium]|nr:plastocyanin/azurin family copper-binding protein [Phycisphaerales bacterium]